MKYEIFGPFEISRSGSLVDKSAIAKKNLWANIEAAKPDLSSAVGCYVYCVGKRPWYVGLAEKQSFRQECFQPHKINAYNSALDQVQGKPCLILIAKITKTGRFAKPGKNGHKASQFLENLLIGMALSRNGKLENVMGTKFLKELVVPGVINTPQGISKAIPVRTLRTILNT